MHIIQALLLLKRETVETLYFEKLFTSFIKINLPFNGWKLNILHFMNSYRQSFLLIKKNPFSFHIVRFV